MPDDASPEKVIRVMANAHLIENGDADELSKLKQEKAEAEAKQDALREWINGNSRGK
ncbi:hypothetical protein [Halostagnicola sp. A56]|uniref:hypothetical protein n=1 Tax=Halostagnicola sp. A56 TaxID=1495067 RepID=UPI0018CF9B4B|nr:hypothetical protein [Halostagnicola sp. A56]